MNCSQYADWLQLSVDGRLDATQQRSLDAHLAGCAECQHDYALLEEQRKATAANFALAAQEQATQAEAPAEAPAQTPAAPESSGSENALSPSFTRTSSCSPASTVYGTARSACCTCGLLNLRPMRRLLA